MIEIKLSKEEVESCAEAVFDYLDFRVEDGSEEQKVLRRVMKKLDKTYNT